MVVAVPAGLARTTAGVDATARMASAPRVAACTCGLAILDACSTGLSGPRVLGPTARGEDRTARVPGTGARDWFVMIAFWCPPWERRSSLSYNSERCERHQQVSDLRVRSAAQHDPRDGHVPRSG